jgi:hypothetical protein
MGRLAQSVERHVYTVDVGSSSLSPPTTREVFMRRVTAVLAASLSLALCFWGSANAAPLNLNDVVEDESPEQLCERVAADPFEGFGPEEWSHPFTRVDFYRALPACTEALKAHPNEQRFALGVALVNVAGKQAGRRQAVAGRSHRRG